MMVVMMMPMVLVSSLLMPVWRTVAGRPEASGYAAPGYACALACQSPGTKHVLKTCLEQTLGARPCPPPYVEKSFFFWFPLRTLIFAEKLRKWKVHGDPKILQNPPKSSPGLPKVPPDGVPEAPLYQKRRPSRNISIYYV